MKRSGHQDLKAKVRRFQAMSRSEMIDQMRFWSDNIYKGDKKGALQKRRRVGRCIEVAEASRLMRKSTHVVGDDYAPPV